MHTRERRVQFCEYDEAAFAMLPNSWQHELRRRHFQRGIRRGRFYTDEKEYALLDTLLAQGDWALDIGANVRHYTMRMAELVGPSGKGVTITRGRAPDGLVQPALQPTYHQVNSSTLFASDERAFLLIRHNIWST